MRKKEVATIILNRNLKNVTDKLHKKILRYNKNHTDVYIVDAGSDEKKKSKFTTWTANWKSARKNGLRFSRGMNFGLSNLYKENKFKDYKYFLLLSLLQNG